MSAPLLSPPPLSAPLPTLAAWTAHFQRAVMPVLEDTARQVEAMRLNEDDVDANLMGEAFSEDPLMSLKVLAHVAERRADRDATTAETVTAALVLLGIGPFFRDFGPQPTVEALLARHPQALQGLRGVLRRSYRAARFALGFAVHRLDQDAALIHQAALLHDFAEMLLWCHAPTLALDIARRQAADPTLRSHVAQREVLHIELQDLQQALIRAWRLPRLLDHIADPQYRASPQVKNVLLAVRLARHSAVDWHNPALPDDLADLGLLLNLAPGPTAQLVHQIDQ